MSKSKRKSPLVDQETCEHVTAYAGSPDGVVLFCSLCGKRLDAPKDSGRITMPDEQPTKRRGCKIRVTDQAILTALYLDDVATDIIDAEVIHDTGGVVLTIIGYSEKLPVVQEGEPYPFAEVSQEQTEVYTTIEVE